MSLILITGASSGIGAATARQFARQGDKVILVARRQAALEACASELGAGAACYPCDASDAEAVAAMARDVLDTHGAPDVIVNAAGAGQWKRLEDTDPAEAAQMMSAPYWAAFHITRAFLPEMRARGSGVVIHVNSPACLVAWHASVGYAAARGALRSFHEALAVDLAGTGVHSCHAIFGRMSTRYFETNQVSEAAFPRFNSLIPILTPQAAGQRLVALAKAPRFQIVAPGALRMALALARVFPALTRRLMRL